MSAPAVEAGRERDALVAEKVMGWTWKRDQPFRVDTKEKYGEPWRFLVAPDSMFAGMQSADGSETVKQNGHIEAPHYSTDIAAAWSILARIHGTSATAPEWLFSRRMRLYAALEELCATTTGCPVAWPAAMGVFHDQMPALICRAALVACVPPSSPMGR